MVAERGSKVSLDEQTTKSQNKPEKKSGVEQNLFQEQKLRAIRTLANGVGQDFNEVLAAIMGYVEMAMLDVPKDSPARPNLGEARNAIDRAKDLVTDLLAFSRLDEQATKPITVETTIQQVLEKLGPTLPSSIELHHNIQTGLGQVNASSAQLRQVVMNLCTNASQAMLERGGRLEVSLDGISAEALAASDTAVDLKSGDYVRLTVRDNGRGIEPEVIDQIFDPYFSTSEKGSGLGMGLALVYSTVRVWNGAVLVESKPGEGSLFTVYLPLL